ncbi:serine protease Do [Weissella uvarum]|uniref:S1C family serine protease n=1 Tax=Weissella uvarum TaxID=1479233 RepID=UPI001961AEA2|nr:trypsin-like peptidase domain-containing protein [Weissella uvarum]MBM7617652.1 serine protease Do [Weissella uvarum]MCM0596001.1 trypsin-like peptidase domain-containing protein [Weissella uvarum]
MTDKQPTGRKMMIIGLCAGLIGGGVSAGAVTYFANQNQTMNQTQTKEVKVQDSKVKGTASATKAFNQVSGAVVSVLNLQSDQSLSAGNLFGEDTNQDDDKTTASEGSGVIYKKAGDAAYVVTNNHVVDGANSLQVLMSDGTKVSAKLVGKDKTTDLAVLKISSKDVKQVAEFANSAKLQPGQTALAIGSPLGSQYATSVTEGIISATNREIDAKDSQGQSMGKATVIQTDAAINPGNSGGPLINLAGQVVGINSMKLAGSEDGTAVEGMGFAIPSNTVTHIIAQLEQNGKVERPSLGISLVDLDAVSTRDQKDVLKLPNNANGVVVMKVSKFSPAATAGLKQYDVITKIDDTKVTDAASLREALYKHKVGDKVALTYYRDGKQQETTVSLNKSQ